MHKRTKIIATIGPSSKSAEMIFQLYKKGMNVVRVNMSHASINDLRDIVRYDKNSNYITSSLAITENTELVNP